MQHNTVPHSMKKQRFNSVLIRLFEFTHKLLPQGQQNTLKMKMLGSTGQLGFIQNPSQEAFMVIYCVYYRSALLLSEDEDNLGTRCELMRPVNVDALLTESRWTSDAKHLNKVKKNTVRQIGRLVFMEGMVPGKTAEGSVSSVIITQ